MSLYLLWTSISTTYCRPTYSNPVLPLLCPTDTSHCHQSPPPLSLSAFPLADIDRAGFKDDPLFVTEDGYVTIVAPN